MVPFLKWPGGKRWFVARHASLLPTVFGRYFEPFLGGGSVFFHLEPDRAVLGDTSTELIATYRAVKRGRKRLERLLARHQRLHSPAHYYRMRDTVPDNWIKRAARTIYLNRTCFNGMYRVNLAGEFNVPHGTETTVLLPAQLGISWNSARAPTHSAKPARTRWARRNSGAGRNEAGSRKGSM